MRDPNNVVEFDDLHVFYTDIGVLKAVDGVTFDVPVGKTVGVVDESGCGKSVSLSLMQLVQRPQQIVRRDRFIPATRCTISQRRPPKMYTIRGNKVSMIFQERRA